MTAPQSTGIAATLLSEKAATYFQKKWPGVAIVTAPILATNQNLPQAQDGLEHEA